MDRGNADRSAQTGSASPSSEDNVASIGRSASASGDSAKSSEDDSQTLDTSSEDGSDSSAVGLQLDELHLLARVDGVPGAPPVRLRIQKGGSIPSGLKALDGTSATERFADGSDLEWERSQWESSVAGRNALLQTFDRLLDVLCGSFMTHRRMF